MVWADKWTVGAGYIPKSPRELSGQWICAILGRTCPGYPGGALLYTGRHMG